MSPWSIRLPVPNNTWYYALIVTLSELQQPWHYYGHDYGNTRYLVKIWKNTKGSQVNFPEAKIWLLLEKPVHNNLYMNANYAFSQLFTGEAGHSVITEKHTAKIPNSTDSATTVSPVLGRPAEETRQDLAPKWLLHMSKEISSTIFPCNLGMPLQPFWNSSNWFSRVIPTVPA